MKRNQGIAFLPGVVLTLVGLGANADAPGMLRVRALGCFFEVPASYTLIADPGDRIELIAPLASGSISIEPFSTRIAEGFSEVSSRAEGHLTILDLTDHDAREPLRLTIIHNRLQAVVLKRSARELAPQVISTCLGKIHSQAPGAPPQSP